MNEQLQLLDVDRAADALRSWLGRHGWQTRRQLCEGLGWSERQVREAAEALGDDVVRGQQGFKLTALIGREDLECAVAAADAAISQGKIMMRYGLRLKRRIRGLV